MVKPSSPTNAVSAAMASRHGRRTGIALAKKGQVAVNEEDQMEDVDALWQSAQTPNPADQDDDNDELASTDDEDYSRKKSPKPRAAAVKKKEPRFSLQGQPQDNDEAEHDAAANNKATHILSKVSGITLSPSEMSRVSTAPPTPAQQKEQEQQQDDEDDPLPSPPEEDQDAQLPPPPLSPPEEGVGASLEDEQHEEVAVATQATAESPTALAAVNTQTPNDNDQDTSFPMDDGADHDDMVPPPPPEEDDDDMNEQAPVTQDDAVEFPHNDDYDDTDEDDDKDGDGYAIVHDPETPDSVRAERLKQQQAAAQEEKAQAKRKRGRPKKNKNNASASSVADSKQSDMSTKNDTKSKKGRGRPKGSKGKKKVEFKESPMGYPAGNRDYEVIPVSDFKEYPPDDGVRRSRRARVKPLAFWRNERPLYEAHNETGSLGEAMGHMPVVSAYISANPTPYKKRKVSAAGNKSKKKQKSSSLQGEEYEESDPPFDSRKLRKKYKIIDGEEANMWDEIEDDITEQKVVSYAESMVATDLPLPSTRKKSEGKIVGKAAQAFNVPTDEDDLYVGYIMGSLKLPPGGIKDPESSGACSLSFTVCHGQPKSVELAYGDPNEQDGELNLKTAQRFLLSPGDMFRVMPGNSYRLENHSKTADCLLSWTIIRPRRNPPPDDDA